MTPKGHINEFSGSNATRPTDLTNESNAKASCDRMNASSIASASRWHVGDASGPGDGAVVDKSVTKEHQSFAIQQVSLVTVRQRDRESEI